MRSLLARTDDLLHGAHWAVDAGSARGRLVYLSGMVALFGMLYGGVMGSFGGVAAGRCWQILYSAVKLPLLLTISFALALPSFFVFNTLFGLRKDFAHAIRALAAMQAGVTVVLASLAPLTGFWYVSVRNYHAAILFNAGMLAVASLAGQQLLRVYYRPLIERSPRHRLMLWAWLIIYGFVGIQMAWVLRPFVGDPGAPPAFFRHDPWGNAYVRLGQIVWSLLGR